jgi:hypothetical protein
MRYILRPPGDTLQWLFKQDSQPHVLPFLPEEKERSLICAQLVAGEILAEVVLSADHLAEVCGQGFPLGRLYFQISRSALYSVCPELTPAVFGES